MTRAQVAQYLGRSIATVRRAEGLHLHPHRESDGVLQFDPGEVRRLREAMARGDTRLSTIDFSRETRVPAGAHARHSRHGSAEQVARLRRELAEVRAVARHAVDLFFTVCPPKFLAELEPDLLDAFESVLVEQDERT